MNLKKQQWSEIINKYLTGNYTMSELADAVGISHQAITKYFQKHISKELAKIKKIRHEQKLIKRYGSLKSYKDLPHRRKIWDQIKEKKRWSFSYTECQNCKKTKNKHWAHGICRKCEDKYKKKYRLGQYEGRRRMPSLDRKKN